MRKILLLFYEIPTMAKIIKQLTIAQVNNAKAAEKIYYLFDGEGLKLVVKPNGVKTWVFNYKRPYTLKRTEKTIGTAFKEFIGNHIGHRTPFANATHFGNIKISTIDRVAVMMS